MTNKAICGIGGGVAALALALLPAAGASAVPPDRFQIDDSSSLDLDCDGTSAHVDLTEQGSGVIRYVGPRGDAHFTVRYEGNAYWTNPATGKSVHLNARFINQDQRVVDNGDGTITLTYHGHFNETDYNSDGSVAFRTQGMDTLELVIDINGTPSNPDDDEVITEDYLGFVGHDGRAGVDFCAWYADQTA